MTEQEYRKYIVEWFKKRPEVELLKSLKENKKDFCEKVLDYSYENCGKVTSFKDIINFNGVDLKTELYVEKAPYNHLVPLYKYCETQASKRKIDVNDLFDQICDNPTEKDLKIIEEIKLENKYQAKYEITIYLNIDFYGLPIVLNGEYSFHKKNLTDYILDLPTLNIQEHDLIYKGTDKRLFVKFSKIKKLPEEVTQLIDKLLLKEKLDKKLKEIPKEKVRKI